MFKPIRLHADFSSDPSILGSYGIKFFFGDRFLPIILLVTPCTGSVDRLNEHVGYLYLLVQSYRCCDALLGGGARHSVWLDGRLRDITFADACANSRWGATCAVLPARV